MTKYGYSLIVIFFIHLSVCFTQEVEFKKDTAGFYYEKIIYKFPSQVDSIIISKGFINDSTCFCIEMDFDHYITRLYVHKIDCLNDSANDNLDKLLQRTNRYYALKNKHIPIFFSSDIIYGFMGFTFTGSVFYISFKGSTIHNFELIKVKY